MANYYKNKFFINIVAVFIALLAVVFFIIYPAMHEITSIKKEIANEKAKLETKLNMGLNIKNVKKDLEEVQSSIDLLDNIFIAKGAELDFITELEQIADQNNIALSINPDFSEDEAKKYFQAVPLQFYLAGDYHNLLNFISELEAMPYYYNIDLIIASTNSDADDFPLNLQLMGQTYIKK